MAAARQRHRRRRLASFVQMSLCANETMSAGSACRPEKIKARRETSTVKMEMTRATSGVQATMPLADACSWLATAHGSKPLERSMSVTSAAKPAGYSDGQRVGARECAWEIRDFTAATGSTGFGGASAIERGEGE